MYVHLCNTTYSKVLSRIYPEHEWHAKAFCNLAKVEDLCSRIRCGFDMAYSCSIKLLRPPDDLLLIPFPYLCWHLLMNKPKSIEIFMNHILATPAPPPPPHQLEYWCACRFCWACWQAITCAICQVFLSFNQLSWYRPGPPSHPPWICALSIVQSVCVYYVRELLMTRMWRISPCPSNSEC